VLNRSVSAGRLGHAFSAHGLAGNLGWAAAPVCMTGIAAFAGWRSAALAAGVLAITALSSLVIFRTVLAAPAAGSGREGRDPPVRESRFAFLGVGAVWMCFAFFVASTISLGALQNFGPPTLEAVYGLPLAAGASALTFYLLGGAAGIAAGGVLAARYQAHERIVAGLLVGAAGFAFVLAGAGVPQAAVAPLMAAIGFCTGTASPSRDLLVRSAAMRRFGQRSFGRIYGFVYSGFDVGLSTAPILFGRFMDGGMPATVLYGVAIFQAIAALLALGVGQARISAASAPVAQPHRPA